MGERAVNREAAKPEDIAEMRRLATQAIEAGAMGFTTSLSNNHRTARGEFIPSKGADAAELSGIYLGPDPKEREAEFNVIRDMVEKSGRPLSVTLLQRIRDPEGWRHTLSMIDDAVEAGLPMRAQVIPRPLGTLFGLDMGRHPFCFHPSYKAIKSESLERRVEIMRDPAFRAKLLSETGDAGDDTLVRRVQNFEYMFPFDDPPNYSPPQESSVANMAKAQGRSPFEVAYDLILEEDGHSMLFAPNSGFGNFSLEGCREIMESPHAIVGVSDGGAHVAHISDVSFSTFLLTYWGRDRAQGPLDVSWLVKRMTGDTAAAIGLNDRGILAAGYKADINVIDHDKLTIERPYMVHDLPKGGKRLLQKARGYVATIVSGVPVYRDGVATGALPGRLVRGAQPAPQA
jgi:N-acyl-D-aspartate/D-glutamate deacylase